MALVLEDGRGVVVYVRPHVAFSGLYWMCVRFCRVVMYFVTALAPLLRDMCVLAVFRGEGKAYSREGQRE